MALQLLSSKPPVYRDDRLRSEEHANNISFKVVHNDGTPISYQILTGLKNIFQKQLPKMPREYITRLVYDRRHKSMVILKPNLVVVGGVTYRPFPEPERRFAEIVFFAVSSSEQVKGYGSYLMNHLKAHLRQEGCIEHFLTYADNYAIGYFKKQGFTKEIMLDRSVWAGLIKDYDGGTLMHCVFVPKVDYLNIYRMLHMQQQELMRRIDARTNCSKVFPGLASFPKSPAEIPGVVAAGWTPEMSAIAEGSRRSRLYEVLRPILNDLQHHPASWPFRQPVDPNEVADYYTIITNPMDLATMDEKLEAEKYKSIAEFTTDVKRVVENCRTYNDPDTNYYKNANSLETYYFEKLKAKEIK